MTLKKDIIVENDYDIHEIIVNHEMSLVFHNCPKITRFPDLIGFYQLETIRLSHCNITECRTYFPDSLRSLSITYCSMKEFVPANLSDNIVEINLSFNKLKFIPHIIKTIYEHNNHIRINLNNNDLWYLMYSDLSPGLLNGTVIDELVFANKLNLVSTKKLQYVVDVLRNKKLTNDARRLANTIGLAIQEKATTLKTTYDNQQNVHLSSVQNSMHIAIDKIFNISVPSIMSFLSIVTLLKSKYKLSVKLIEFMDSITKNDYHHSGYNISYSCLFERVFAIIVNSQYKDDMIKVFIEELEDTTDVCLTGKMTRIVNVLNGFILDVNVGISKNEELANDIIVLRNRFAKIYVDDPDKYITELVPVVWQLLEDNCIPQNEQEVWLEYV